MPDGIGREKLLPRVLMTTDAVGGVWRYTLDLAQAFRDRDVGTVLAVLGPAPSEAQRDEARRAGLDPIETGLALDWTAGHPAELTAVVGQLQALARKTRVAGAHLHAPALAGDGWPIPTVAVAHSCVATWWHAVRGTALPDDFRWRTEATAAGLRAADAVIAPTSAHAEAVRAAYGPVRVEVVHNGSGFPDRPATATVRRRAVLTAGRLWDEGKNAAALDRVAPELDAPIRAAGPTKGPNGDAIHLSNLHLLGNLGPAGMEGAYAASTVFASMARYEPFGLSVLEAARAGLRLVLADIPSFRELWDGAAFFVRDEADLLGALRSALDAAGDGGARVRAARYTIDATADATLALHRAVGVPV